MTACDTKTTISVDLRRNLRWERADANNIVGWAIGYAFLEGNFLEGKDLVKIFFEENNLDSNALISLVKRLNGNFAVIIERKDAIFACVDRVRSYPLFYSIKDSAFFIGDDAHRIKKRLEVKSADSDAIEEFLMSGYVSQKGTLFNEIKQLLPGEILHVTADKEGSLKDIRTHRYYIYYNMEKTHLSLDKMIDVYDDILVRVFERLIKSVQGKKIIVPLSGGVDSRLVAYMLKRLKYKNVLCMTYGIKNSWERDEAERVAEKLGYEWEYIIYSHKKWNDVYRTQEWKNFFYSYDNLSSLPNINDWIAVHELKFKRLIPDDAVFVPAHTGDFICGGHLISVFGKRDSGITKNNLTRGLINKHYGLQPAKLKDSAIRGYLINKLSRFFERVPLDSDENIASAYEYWEWQERQAKFIVNSVRTYDFYGYEWRIPLWDNELMDFWSVVPYPLKLKKKLYSDYLAKKDEFGLFGKEPYRTRLRKRRLFPWLKKFIEYYTDPMGTYGIYGYFPVTFKLIANKIKNVNSLLARDYVKEFQKI